MWAELKSLYSYSRAESVRPDTLDARPKTRHTSLTKQNTKYHRRPYKGPYRNMGTKGGRLGSRGTMCLGELLRVNAGHQGDRKNHRDRRPGELACRAPLIIT